MSLMPRGSDDIAGLLGVGALVGALTGARAPKRGSRPGLLSTLLARSIEEERAAQEARIRQEQAQMAFLGNIAPKMLEMGIPMGSIFNDEVYARLGMNPEEMNKAITTVAVKGMLPALQQYAPHATREQLAGLASGDYHRAADFFVSDANRDVHRNAALFPALVQQLGSANGLTAIGGMTQDGRAMLSDGSVFNNTGGLLAAFGLGDKGAKDQAFVRADTLNANANRRASALSAQGHSQDVALVREKTAAEAVKVGLGLGLNVHWGDPELFSKVSGAVAAGQISTAQGAKDLVVAKFNEGFFNIVAPWLASPKGKEEDEIEAERRKRLEANGKAPAKDAFVPDIRLKTHVAAYLDSWAGKLGQVGVDEKEIARLTSQVNIPTVGPKAVLWKVQKEHERQMEGVKKAGDPSDILVLLQNKDNYAMDILKKVIDGYKSDGYLVYGIGY
jgi:hypothetical protein